MKNKATAFDTIRELTKNKSSTIFETQNTKKNWDRFKSDPFNSPFYTARYKLSKIDYLVILGSNHIVLPEKLQEQEIKLTHNLPHLGQNNTGI